MQKESDPCLSDVHYLREKITVQHQKLKRFALTLQEFITLLNKCKELDIHRNINQFYYMQKAEELKVMILQTHELRKKAEKIMGRIDMSYAEIYFCWNRDVQVYDDLLNKRRSNRRIDKKIQ